MEYHYIYSSRECQRRLREQNTQETALKRGGKPVTNPILSSGQPSVVGQILLLKETHISYSELLKVVHVI